FQAREYEVPRFGPAQWLPGGTSYSILERSAERPDEWAIVRRDVETRSTLIVLRQVPPVKTTPIAIDDYAWSRDGSRLLIFGNTRKVWRQNTRGDYWVFDLSSGALRQLGGGAPEASLMFAKFSPDATRVAYVRANNIYVERVD